MKFCRSYIFQYLNFHLVACYRVNTADISYDHLLTSVSYILQQVIIAALKSLCANSNILFTLSLISSCLFFRMWVIFFCFLHILSNFYCIWILWMILCRGSGFYYVLRSIDFVYFSGQWMWLNSNYTFCLLCNSSWNLSSVLLALARLPGYCPTH